jgi:hypothetical protein
MRRRFSSGECPFSGTIASHGACSEAVRGVARVPFCGELSLPFRVVRISRLSGNSDTTACRATAQVKVRRRGHPGSQCGNGGESARNATRASLLERRPSFSCWSLASQLLVGGGFSLSPLRLPRPVSLVSGPLPYAGRMLLPGALCCLGRPVFFFGSLFITGALYIAIAVPICRR